MGERNRRLTVYVDDDLDSEIERQAERRDMSKSQFAAMAIEEFIDQDLLDGTSRRAGAERRLEELVAQATDEIEAAADRALDEMVAHAKLRNAVLLQAGLYSKGTWELVKDDAGDVAAQQAMQSASQSFEADADAMGIDLNALGTRRSRSSAGTPSDGGTESSQRSSASSQSQQDDDEEWQY